MNKLTSYRRSTYAEQFDSSVLDDLQSAGQAEEGRKFAVLHDAIVEAAIVGSSASEMYEAVLRCAVSLAQKNQTSVSEEELLEVVWISSLTIRRLAKTASSRGIRQLPTDVLKELVALLIDKHKIPRLKVMEVFDDALLGDCKLIEVDRFNNKKNRIITKNV